jgi:hypothetical protein
VTLDAPPQTRPAAPAGPAVGAPVVPPVPRRFGRWAPFALGLAAVLLLAALLRWPATATAPAAGDEATVVDRAVLVLDGRLAPPAFDWPPGSSYLLAAAVLAGRLAGFDAAADPLRLLSFARLLFAAVAVAVVALTGLLGAALADGGGPGAPSRRAAATGLVAALAMAVSFVSVRLSRAAHPEHLQMLLVLLALAAGLRFDRTRRRRWLLAAGTAAGLAGAVKYLGVTVALVPLLAAVAVRGVPRSRRLADAAMVAAATLGGFVAGTLGTTVRGTAFVRGFADQWLHQAGGHLGYEADGPTWWFHLTTVLPGTWGWPLTIAALAGIGLVARRGSRAQRLTAAYTAALLTLVGLSQITFPHYVLVATPLLAVLAAVALTRGAAALARAPRSRWAGPVVAGALVAASLAPVVLDDLRLRRLDAAPTTTGRVADLTAGLPGPVWAEHHTGVPAPARSAFSLAEQPADFLACDCLVAVSSYQEDRYRRLPERYAAEVAGYDAIRAAGEVVDVVAPGLPLSYRWDLLPAWGLRRIPLTGPLPLVGPTVTLLDLRTATP